MNRTLWIALALAVLSLSVGSAPAIGNPILFAPTGSTLTTGQFRAEAAFSTDNDHGKYFWLGAGLMRFEANVTRFAKPGGEDENLIGVQWSFLPETSITPGVSFGVWDATSQSDDGIGGYVAVTKHVPTDIVLPLLKDVSGTIGVGFGGIKGLFAGVEAKLPLGLFIQAEYDSRDFNAAVGLQPIELLRLKVYSIGDEYYYGAELVPITF